MGKGVVSLLYNPPLPFLVEEKRLEIGFLSSLVERKLSFFQDVGRMYTFFPSLVSSLLLGSSGERGFFLRPLLLSSSYSSSFWAFDKDILLFSLLF